MGGEAYTDPRYGVPHRHLFQTQDDLADAGLHEDNMFSVPFKIKITKFGVIPARGSKPICSSTTTFSLKTRAGTEIAKFVPGSAQLATATATGVTVATNVAANKVLIPAIGEAGDKGSVFYFFDYHQVYDSA